MVSAALIYFLTSLLIPGSAALRSRNGRRWLTAAGALYALFCLTAFGKIAGLIPAAPLYDIIYQPGYDCHLLPLPLSAQLMAGFWAGAAFNLFTAVWIWWRGGPVWYGLAAVSGFCIGGFAAAPWVGLTPIDAWFSVCCITMAAVGWVLGLTYIQVCVLLDLWLPIAAVMSAAAYLIYTAVREPKPVSIPAVVAGAIQLAAGIVMTVHYAGPLAPAFYRCVRDLHYGADALHLPYMLFNIVAYGLLFIGLLVLDILWAQAIIHRKPTLHQRH